MENLLSNYLDRRLDKSFKPFNQQKSGPVITISREVGCNGLKLANGLAEILNKQSQGRKWKVLSKEVFFECAKELNLDYNRIIRYFKNTDHYTFEEILYAFNNKNYKSERKIVKTLIDVIHTFAVEGYCIIVGRAGHIIARDIKNSLHIRLVAPLEFRIKTIMQNNNLSHNDAAEFIKRVEKERIAFRKALREEVIHEVDFDLILNRGSFEKDETIDIILEAVEIKNLLTPAKEQVFLF
ncbi:MAG: cytidylate kinase-like family protein [Prolixibacteraceae bacterium]|nr:cytidylate kinase-like family protein [Prolixibacteraceae bacterium]MBN2775401.1 cytidylate kinase-like family protein [Prolixibacteraceae bacterium]